MARHHLLLAAVAVLAPLPAFAGVTVLGMGHARACYEAAESPAMPLRDDLDECDAALAGSATPFDDQVATRVNRGILHLRRGNLDRALADFDAATAMDPTEPEAYLNRGSLLLRQNQVEDAIAMFTAAIEHNTRRPELAYYGRGVAFETSGNIRAAYNDYRRAQQLAPRWDEPRLELARFRVVGN